MIKPPKQQYQHKPVWAGKHTICALLSKQGSAALSILESFVIMSATLGTSVYSDVLLILAGSMALSA